MTPGFRFYFDKDESFLFDEETKWCNEREAKRNAKQRLRMYASLYCRDVRKVLINEGSVCKFCGVKEKLVPDHIIPISKGGKNQEVNIQILCHRCNSIKGNKI